MKAFRQPVSRIASNPSRSFLARLVLLSVAIVLPLSVRGNEVAKTFATPEEAVATLATVIEGKERDALRTLFGSAVENITNPDRVQATNEFTAFAAALDKKHRIVLESSTKCVLLVGTNSWPFPIPIVQRDGRWFFDTAAGEEEIANRRIGKNELEVLQVMCSYVDAQREYASRDRDNDGVLEYAQRIASTPGQTDGLYWPPDMNGEISPLGPLIASAQSGGYFGENAAADAGPQPFHGYLFKILKRQGKHAPGGAYNYVINDNMIGGFGLVAWPVEYGHTGIMTFIVNQQGLVYQKDLGGKTSRIATKMSAYDPDNSWQLSPD